MGLTPPFSVFITEKRENKEEKHRDRKIKEEKGKRECRGGIREYERKGGEDRDWVGKDCNEGGIM